jgi:hypothetical protein
MRAWRDGLLAGDLRAGSVRPALDLSSALLGPATPTRTKALENGIVLGAYRQTGVIVSENPASPWRHATLLVQGTIVTDPAGKVIRDVALYESTDADGDLTWSVLWRPAAGPGALQLIVGTGKWEGISGEGKTLGMLRRRTDDHYMLRSEMHWKIDREE